MVCRSKCVLSHLQTRSEVALHSRTTAVLSPQAVQAARHQVSSVGTVPGLTAAIQSMEVSAAVGFEEAVRALAAVGPRNWRGFRRVALLTAAGGAQATALAQSCRASQPLPSTGCTAPEEQLRSSVPVPLFTSTVPTQRQRAPKISAEFVSKQLKHVVALPSAQPSPRTAEPELHNNSQERCKPNLDSHCLCRCTALRRIAVRQGNFHRLQRSGW